MGFRFWKRVSVAPGLDLNLSKSGFSVSSGPPGLKASAGEAEGEDGGTASTGIPGSDLFYTKRLSGGSDSATGARRSESGGMTKVSEKHAERALSPGCWGSLTMPEDQRELLTGLREIATGNYKKSLGHLLESGDIPDGAFLAGLIALRHGRLKEAGEQLTRAYENHERLGRFFREHGIGIEFGLPITEEVYARITSDRRGAVLAMAELAQLRGNREFVLKALEWLHRENPEDPVVRLALAEALMDENRDDPDECHRVVELAAEVENESPVHAALLFYKALALRELDMDEQAKQTLTEAKNGDDLPPGLLHEALYQRGLTYEKMGQQGNAQNDFEELNAMAPDFEDVRERVAG